MTGTSIGTTVVVAIAGAAVVLRSLIIPVTGVTEFISTVRVSVDQRQQQDWNEIDAVRLSGFRRP